GRSRRLWYVACRLDGGVTEKPHVLIVDDDPLIRDLLRSTLREDYHVEEVPDGRRALNRLERAHLDVIITDNFMPHVSGVELLTWASHDAPQTVGLLITGYENLPEVQNATERGAIYGIIAKPFDRQFLLEMVRKAVAEANARRG